MDAWFLNCTDGRFCEHKHWWNENFLVDTCGRGRSAIVWWCGHLISGNIETDPCALYFCFVRVNMRQQTRAKANEQVDQKIERVSQPESILSGGEQRNKLLAQALEHWSITTSTEYQQIDTAILGTSIYKTSTEYQQLDTTILGDMHTPMDGCISLDVLSI